MNPQKIAFITCVNKEDEYREALYYIHRQRLPRGFSFECIAVRGAKSMAGGYNLGMRGSDAKYKIYLHQDLHIVHPEAISNFIEIFASDPAIGIAGVAGTLRFPGNGCWWEYPPLLGGCYQTRNGKPFPNNILCSPYCDEHSNHTAVCVLDGLILATQYDLPWRDDLFSSWHFYDLSQCCEFHRRGYQAVVPSQQIRDQQGDLWVLHNGDNGGINDAWQVSRLRFLAEYPDVAKKYGAAL